jgi:hypothetical protein
MLKHTAVLTSALDEVSGKLHTRGKRYWVTVGQAPEQVWERL